MNIFLEKLKKENKEKDLAISKATQIIEILSVDVEKNKKEKKKFYLDLKKNFFFFKFFYLTINKFLFLFLKVIKSYFGNLKVRNWFKDFIIRKQVIDPVQVRN